MLVQSMPYPANVSDPYFANVVLLVGFEASFTDESSYAHAATLVNAPTRTTTNPIIGTTSGSFSGTSWADYGHPVEFDMGTNDFTIEFRIRPATSGATSVHFTGAGNAPQFRIGINASNRLFAEFQRASGHIVVPTQSGSAPLVAGTAEVIAVDKASGVYRLYRNGLMVAKVTDINPLNAIGDNGLSIGTSPLVNGFNGQIDEYRYTNGVARYASDGGYSPSTAPFPRA